MFSTQGDIKKPLTAKEGWLSLAELPYRKSETYSKLMFFPFFHRETPLNHNLNKFSLKTGQNGPDREEEESEKEDQAAEHGSATMLKPQLDSQSDFCLFLMYFHTI